MFDFKKIFHLKEVDHPELLQILLFYFGSAESTKKGCYRYKKDGTNYFLDIQLNKNDEIVEIKLPKVFPGEILNKIENKIKESLIDNQEFGIGQVVGFSLERVEGYLRYKDLFQIIPVPDYAPKPGMLIARHPFLLQFCYTISPNVVVDNMRRSHKAVTYIRLLNSFLNLSVTLSSRYSRSFWIIEAENDTNFTSKWKQEGYVYAGFSGKISNYSPADKLSEMRRVPHENYYSPKGITSNPLVIPDSIEKSLDLALGLNEQEWTKYFMACSWFYQSSFLWHESNSSAYVALANAIECLIEKDKVRCECCGQLKYSVNKKFKDFIIKYVPEIKNNFAEELELIYKVRSNLSHGLNLLGRDLKPWNFIMSKKVGEEDILQRNLEYITKIALYNWLRDR